MRLRHRLRVTASLLALAALATAASAVANQQTPQSVQITGKPPDPSNLTTPTFTFTSDQADATFECSLDGTAGAACSSPNQATTLANGSHTFTVWAIRNGARSDPASYTWTVDTTPPQIKITPSVPPVTNST